MKQEFFITLPSNVVEDDANQVNLVTNYKTHLKQRIEFPANEDWRVGVSEIFYTKSWFNIKNTTIIEFVGDTDGLIYQFDDFNSFDPPIENKHLNRIEPGYFKTVPDLISYLNLKFAFFDTNNITPKLYFDKHSSLVKVSFGVMETKKGVKQLMYPMFGVEVEKILGLIHPSGITMTEALLKASEENPNKKYEPSKFDLSIITATRKADIRAGLNSIYIYSDVAQYSFVGDAYAQLLRVIPVQETENWGDIVHHVFDKPHLIPVQARNFHSIEIDIRDDTGSNIAFESGRFVVKLLFRKYDKPLH